MERIDIDKISRRTFFLASVPIAGSLPLSQGATGAAATKGIKGTDKRAGIERPTAAWGYRLSIREVALTTRESPERMTDLVTRPL